MAAEVTLDPQHTKRLPCHVAIVPVGIGRTLIVNQTNLTSDSVCDCSLNGREFDQHLLP